jgi:hypothetical protein
VDRIQERATIWLGQARGFTDPQLVALHQALNELRNRLITARFDTAISGE